MPKHPGILRLIHGLTIAGILACAAILLAMLLRAPRGFCLTNVQLVKGAIIYAPV